MKIANRIQLTFPSRSANEGFARLAVAGFVAQLDPTVDELAELKTVISEAVTNCTVHAYRDTVGEIRIIARLLADTDGGTSVEVEIKDKGCGIPDVACARQPLYTTDAEGERSGMGFTVMESFTDRMRVRSRVGKGTTVVLTKKLNGRQSGY